MSKMMIIHLSDIHFTAKDNKVLNKLDKLVESTYSKLHRVESVCIIISGDIANSGQQDEYNIAERFLDDIKVKIQSEKNIPIYFVLVPGNHDCDFTEDQSIRNLIIDKVIQNGAKEITEPMIAECLKPFKNFNKFKIKYEPKYININDGLWTSYAYCIGKHNVVFDCPNIAWMSRKQEVQGNLLFPTDNYESLMDRKYDLKIAVFHHPVNWHNQKTYSTFRSFIRKLAHIVITGHEHINNVGEINEYDSGCSAYVAGGVIQTNDDNYAESYNLIEIDLKNHKYTCDLMEWNGNRFVSIKNNAWENYRKLPLKTYNDFQISDAFMRRLEDPGGNFSHPDKQDITLSDVYVFPDLLRSSGNNMKLKDTLNSIALAKVDECSGGVLLKGSEVVGKTSLLYQLYIKYNETGYVPILIDGNNLKYHETDLLKVIYSAVITQYGNDKLETYKQTSKELKIVLVDDFDALKLTNEQRNNIINTLNSEFNLIIITTTELFELEELLEEGTISKLAKFNQFTIKEFGYKLRFQLIRKWTSISDMPGKDSAEVVNMLDKTEKSLNTIIGKNLIPRVPIYILSILQSIDTGQAAELQNSAYGDCYRFLITAAFTKNGIKPIEMQEYIQFLSYLSYEYCKNNTNKLDSLKLKEYNNWFSDKFYKRDFDVRINLMISCNIIDMHGDYYSFKYPYLYNYFLGKYLSDNLQNKEIRDLITKYCKHLYIRKHANAILFLAHHSRDAFVYEQVANVLTSLFAGVKPLSLANDLVDLRAIVNDSPKLIYNKKDVIAKRMEVCEAKDEFECESTADDDELVPDDYSALTLTSMIMFLIKTVEILGQILKNQYATIPTEDRKRLVVESLNGPLRLLGEFTKLCNKDHKLMLTEIEKIISEYDSKISEERKCKLARRAVFQLIGTTLFAFIHKTGTCIGSEYLNDLITEVANSNDTEEYRLIELVAKLDTYSKIPMPIIEKLTKKTSMNPYTKYIMQQIILNHLYMFKTKESEKQSLCKLLDISVTNQHLIDMKTGKDSVRR